MLKKISSRIYYLPGETETDRPNLYYIQGDQLSLAVDAGNSKAHVELFYKQLLSAGLKLPDYTVITHWHWDHTFGLSAITGRSIATKMTNDQLTKVKGWEWTEEKMREREASGLDLSFCNECIKKEYPNLHKITVVNADMVVEKPYIIDLGGVHCRLIPHDSTHSRDALFVYAEEEKALFVGDADCEDLYDNDGKYDPKRLKNLEEFITGFEFSLYLLGHDVPQTWQEALSYLKEMREKNPCAEER